MRTRRFYRGGKGKTKSNKKTTTTSSNKYSDKAIVSMFLQMLNTVKLYHWKTSSFSQHKATDELYSELNSNIDSFVETMLGKDGSRVDLTGTKNLPLMDYTSVANFEKEVEKYKVFLQGMSNDSKLNITANSDLLNIRDELLGSLNKFTYLLTLK